MAPFDPYHKWLGIPPRDQPPDHYRLLGLVRFEPDPEVIASAADARMGHVRSFQSGRHGDVSQRILNELAAARLCLLSAEKKTQYDAALVRDFGSLGAAPNRPIPVGPIALTPTVLPVVARSRGAKRAHRSTRAGAWIILGVLAAIAAGLIAILATTPDKSRKSRPALAGGGVGTVRVSAERREDNPPLTPDEKPNTTPQPTEDTHQEGVAQAKPQVASLKPDAATAKPPAPPAPPGGPADNELAGGDELRPKRMGKFVMALCQDLEGNLWVGTEDTGVWRFNPNAERGRRWARFTRANTGGPPEPDGPTILSPLPPGAGRVRASSSPRPSAGEGPGVRAASFLGDDHAYALACDKLGRVWVGHLNHGVSVYNGREWRNYDVLTGPLGERVFDIETCPVDGDVWIATNCGLARYRLAEDTWCYYTRADGLPADDVQCLAFAPDGTLYAGTQCDGLAIATPSRARGQLEHRAWRVVAGMGISPISAEDASPGRRSPLPQKLDSSPFAPFGEGLPSDLINDVLVARDGTVYAATITGLAASRDRGRTWQYLRGQNWETKARGLLNPPSKEQLDAAAKLAKDRTLLAEDYVTCLAEDEQGNLWVGHREKGFEVFDPRTGKRLAREEASPPKSDGKKNAKKDEKREAKKGASPPKKPDPGQYVTRLLSLLSFPSSSLGTSGQGSGLGTSGMLAATYGAGVAQASSLSGVPEPAVLRGKPAPGRLETCPTLPSPARPPTADDIRDLAAEWSRPARGPRPKSPLVIALPDDWRTQGDWLGRYGRYWACCCAICSPADYLWGAGERPVEYHARIGPHCTPDDSIRYWVHWLYTDDRRTLEMPPTYAHSRIVKGLTTWGRIRRQAEWDDHGESYPRTHQGPDLYCTLKIPEGLFFLSLYDFNKDGHDGPNRFRDYQVSIRAHDPSNPSLFQIDGFERQPELARARIHDFWGGVWKRFLVQGPAELTIHVARNDSFNTILAGVMLDLVDEEPPPYFVGQIADLSAVGQVSNLPGAGRIANPSHADLDTALRSALARLDEVQTHHPAQWAVLSRCAYATLLRAAFDIPGRDDDTPRARAVSPQLAASCAYHCALFPDWEREQSARGLTTARSLEKALRWDEKTYTFSGRGYAVLAASKGVQIQRPNTSRE